MKRTIGFLSAGLVVMSLASFGWYGVQGGTEAKPMLAHMVYFKLKDGSESNRKKLVSACHKYLSGHDGTVYYSAGTRGEEFDREVNARDYDVALNLVFDSKGSHDAYQESARHQTFIAENSGDWAGVKVYDSYVTKP